eukprot:m.251690 g.251690  ORF g.251690 m.251690 type:complete len:351 (+) comp17362_c0_seq1:94-1146(+)
MAARGDGAHDASKPWHVAAAHAVSEPWSLHIPAPDASIADYETLQDPQPPIAEQPREQIREEMFTHVPARLKARLDRFSKRMEDGVAMSDKMVTAGYASNRLAVDEFEHMGGTASLSYLLLSIMPHEHIDPDALLVLPFKMLEMKSPAAHVVDALHQGVLAVYASTIMVVARSRGLGASVDYNHIHRTREPGCLAACLPCCTCCSCLPCCAPAYETARHTFSVKSTAHEAIRIFPISRHHVHSAEVLPSFPANTGKSATSTACCGCLPCCTRSVPRSTSTTSTDPLESDSARTIRLCLKGAYLPGASGSRTATIEVQLTPSADAGDIARFVALLSADGVRNSCAPAPAID